MARGTPWTAACSSCRSPQKGAPSAERWSQTQCRRRRSGTRGSPEEQNTNLNYLFIFYYFVRLRRYFGYFPSENTIWEPLPWVDALPVLWPWFHCTTQLVREKVVTNGKSTIKNLTSYTLLPFKISLDERVKLTHLVLRRVFRFILLIICQFHTASETMWGLK